MTAQRLRRVEMKEYRASFRRSEKDGKEERTEKMRVTRHRANKRGKTSSKSIRCSGKEGGRRTKRGEDIPSAVDALPSAGRLLRLFKKSQQSSTASFAQWLRAIVPRPSFVGPPPFFLCRRLGIVFAHRRVSVPSR